MNARLVAVHTSLLLRALLRTPAFAIPVIVFPAMFYVIFALQFAKQSAAVAGQMLASYVAFGVIGVALFQFGVGIANERGRPWERYLRTLPISVETRFAARVLVALFFAIVSGGLVAILGAFLTPVDFTPAQWLLLACYTLTGAVPFVLLGVAIAYVVPAAGAIPITNIVYLLCAFAGGLWIPPQFLPKFAAVISPFLPTRAYGELLWSVGERGHEPVRWLIALACFALAFAVIAVIAYRRDEKSRYA